MVILELDTGETTTLYDDSSYLVSAKFGPSFTPDGTAVWISSIDGDSATRFGLNGEVLYEILGAWGVQESVDGLSRTYLLRDEDGELNTTRAVERGGIRRLIETPGAGGVLSPDGTRIAFRYWLDRGAPDPLAIDVVDIARGDRWTIATNLGPCGCDGGPAPAWSPSGEFIAYVDFEAPRGNPDDEFGAYIAAVDGSTVIRRSDSGWFTDEWLVNVDGSESMSYAAAEGFFRFDTATGASTLVYAAPTDEEWQVLALLIDSFLVFESAQFRADERTVLIALDGTELGAWPGRADVVMGPNGVAASGQNLRISPSRPDLECTGLWYDRPLLEEPGCIEGGNWATWSPDASMIATTVELEEGGWAVIIENVESRARIEIPSPKSWPAHLEWNDQGTHLLVAWGVGL